MQVSSTQLNLAVFFKKASKMLLLTSAFFMAGFTLKAQLTIVASDTTLCTGDSATLTVSGGATYNWISPAEVSGDTGAVIKVGPNNTVVPTEYVVVDPNTMDTGRISIAVSQLPFINVSTTADLEGRFICVDSSVTMTAFATNASYIWSPSATLNVDDEAIVVATPTANTEYFVTVTDTITTCWDVRSINISRNAIPPSLIIKIVGDSVICENDSTSISVSGAQHGYNWIGPNVNDPTSSIVKVAPTSTQDYIVIGRSQGCTSRDTVSIEVNPAPAMSASTTPVGSICLDEVKVVTINGDPIVKYIWNFPTQELTTVSNVLNVSPNIPGLNTVIVTGVDANNCTNSITVTFQVDSCYVGPVPGYGEFNLEQNIKAYLGQGEQVVVSMDGSLNGTYRMRMLNLLGSEIYGTTINKYDGQTSSYSIDLSNQPSGIYILQLEDQAGSRFAEKIVKP